MTNNMLSLATKIKIEMLKKRITGAEIARQTRVTRVAIHLAIKGEIKSEKLRRAIEHALGMKFWTENNKNQKAA